MDDHVDDDRSYGHINRCERLIIAVAMIDCAVAKQARAGAGVIPHHHTFRCEQSPIEHELLL